MRGRQHESTPGTPDSSMDEPSARRRHFERHLVGEMRHAWILDVACAGALTAAVLTRSVVVWFHLVFLVLALAALVLSFRRFTARLVVWTGISGVLVAWSVVQGHTPAVELTELPLMTAVLVLTYLGAQARGHVVDRLVRTQDELVERTENEVEALRHQLEQAQRLEVLGRASQSIAHDLRNVFTVINGCVVELTDEMRGRQAIVRVHEVSGATDRGMAIVSDLLLSARQGTDQGGSVDLGDVTQHLEPLLRRLAGRQVTLGLHCAGAPVRARIDRTSVLQILMNLVVNAAEAITGPGTIVVRCEQHMRRQPDTAPRELAVLTVTDDGIGISDDAATQIFEPGFSTKGADHTGLGLATVCRIAERWGGTVELDSLPGRGTTVRVELPLYHDAMRALVVVADRRARELLAAEVAGAGYEVIATDCALDACDQLADVDTADLAFLDGVSAADPSLQRAIEIQRISNVVVMSPHGDAQRGLPTDLPAARAVVAHAIGGRPLTVG
jgi:signal transduction histidine kinase